MNTQMGNSLPKEKLDQNNFVSWEYKMHQYLVVQGYWCYKAAQEMKPNPTHTDYPTWEQATIRVLYCLATCLHDYMLDYIREAKTLKEPGENLKVIFAANTIARKLQSYQELSNVQQKDMSITSYILMIKELYDSLSSIKYALTTSHHGSTPCEP